MDLLLNCSDLRKVIGPRLLFDGISLTLNRADRLGIIGANGTGKSTLLRLMAGLEQPDSGMISLVKNTRTAYLGQTEKFGEDKTAAEVLSAVLEQQGTDQDERDGRVHAMLSLAEFDNPDVRAGRLSGGWRKRLAICRAFIQRADILLLDEPTNHLDLEGILWLEKLLTGSFPDSPAALVLVSHDRALLDNIASRVLEISPAYPRGFLAVDGSYSLFRRRKEEFLEQQEELEARVANRARRESEWLQRGPKARTTKAKYRVDETHRLHQELAGIRERNRAGQAVQFDFSFTGRRTRKLLEAKGLAKSLAGRKLFAGLDVTLTPGRRLALLGPNGCGKSTLMKILAAAGNDGEMEPDRGNIRVAEGVRIVSFSQDREKLDLSATLRQALAPEGETVVYRDRPLHLVTWAKKFLFRPDQLDTPVANLSGGELAKILIAGLMRTPADILLLDEPTNDLDIPSLQVLEESILEFPGAVVLTTHDRFLMNSVCDEVLGFCGGGKVTGFSDYGQWFAACGPGAGETGKKASPGRERKRGGKVKGRLSYMDQREYDSMEERILEAEDREQELLRLMESPGAASDPELLEEYWRQLETVRRDIHALYSRWEELEKLREEGT
jgi:ATP-binding cassette subfamily F protein uup